MTIIAGDRLMNLAFPIDRETRHRQRPFAYEYFTQKRSSGNNTWIIVQRSSARHCWLRRLYELQPMVQNGAVLWLNWIALQKLSMPLSSEYMREHQRLSHWFEDALTAASRCDPQWPGGKSSSLLKADLVALCSSISLKFSSGVESPSTSDFHVPRDGKAIPHRRRAIDMQMPMGSIFNHKLC